MKLLPKQEKTVTIAVRMTVSGAKAVKKAARKARKTISAYGRIALEEKLANTEVK